MIKLWRGLIVNTLYARPNQFMRPMTVVTLAKSKAGAASRIRARLRRGEVVMELSSVKSLVYRV